MPQRAPRYNRTSISGIQNLLFIIGVNVALRAA